MPATGQSAVVTTCLGLAPAPADPVPSERLRWRPRITHARPRPDLDAAESAATALLAALGLDLDDVNLVDTPRRMARAKPEPISPIAAQPAPTEPAKSIAAHQP